MTLVRNDSINVTIELYYHGLGNYWDLKNETNALQTIIRLRLILIVNNVVGS